MLRRSNHTHMPGTFSPPPQVSDPDMHHCTCVKHVPWCITGSLTSGFVWSRWRMRNPQFYVSCKRPMYNSLHTHGHYGSAVNLFKWWSSYENVWTRNSPCPWYLFLEHKYIVCAKLRRVVGRGMCALYVECTIIHFDMYVFFGDKLRGIYCQ